MTKTIAVIGVTGNQGSSVARVFLNEPGWKVRGVARDPSKPAAQKWSSQGVEIVQGDLNDPASLKKAFQGANVIFGTTDFWAQLSDPSAYELATKQNRTPNEVAYDRELAQIKAIIDAAAANIDTLDRFVLSTLPDARKWSNETIKWVLHFDDKAEAVNYLKSTYPDLLAKTSFLHLGFYATNWKQGNGMPKKQEDGSYVVSLPMSGDRKLPMADAAADTGHFTKALVQLPAGTSLSGAGSYISFNEWCEIFGRVHNVKCVFERIPLETLKEALGPVYGLELGDMFEYFDKFGYNGGEKVVFPWELDVNVKVTTMEDYIKGEDWSSVL